jgi:hypothetical protein
MRICELLQLLYNYYITYDEIDFPHNNSLHKKARTEVFWFWSSDSNDFSFNQSLNCTEKGSKKCENESESMFKYFFINVLLKKYSSFYKLQVFTLVTEIIFEQY